MDGPFPEELWQSILSYTQSSVFWSFSQVSKASNRRSAIILHAFLLRLLAEHPLDGPSLSWLLNRSRHSSLFSDALKQAVTETPSIRITIALSADMPPDNPSSVLHLLRTFLAFLASCFPSDSEAGKPLPRVQLTIHPAPDGSDQYIQAHTHLLPSLPRTLHLALTLDLAEHTWPDMSPFLPCIDRARIDLGRGLVVRPRFHRPSPSPATFLSLTNPPTDPQTLAAQLDDLVVLFPHVSGIKLDLSFSQVEVQPDPRPPLLACFPNLTTLAIELVGSMGPLDLSSLPHLRHLKVGVERAPEEISLPEGISSFSLETGKHAKLYLTPELKDHLWSLSELTRIEFIGFRLHPTSPTVLPFFPPSLAVLDLHHSRSAHLLGKPPSGLRELRVGNMDGGNAWPKAGYDLRVFSAKASLLSIVNPSLLGVLSVSDVENDSYRVHSLTLFSALVELWAPIDFFTDAAIDHAQEGRILDVLPSTLDLLVLHSPRRDGHPGACWDFRPLPRLMYLGWDIQHPTIEPGLLPRLLRTLAVSTGQVMDLRARFSQAQTMTRVVPFNSLDQERGGPITPNAAFEHVTDFSDQYLNDLLLIRRTEGAGDGD